MKNAEKNLKRLTLVFLTAVALSVTGCQKAEYHQLSDSDMEWLVYDNNEVDVFKNGAKTVNYYVTLRTKAYNESGNQYNEFTAANFLMLNDTSAYTPEDSKGVLFIYKQDDESLLVTFSWPHFPIKEYPISSMPYTIETINGIIYTDIFLIDATGLADARFYISKIWYSQSEGVMQYEDIDGDLWVKDI